MTRLKQGVTFVYESVEELEGVILVSDTEHLRCIKAERRLHTLKHPTITREPLLISPFFVRVGFFKKRHALRNALGADKVLPA